MGYIAELRRAYGSLTGELLRRLSAPPRRLYMRVNTLLASRDEVLELLREEGVEAFADEYLEEAIYVEVEGPFELDCDIDKYVQVDERAGSSLMLGANLYRPGVLRASSFRKGDLLIAYDKYGRKVACLEAAVDSRELHKMGSGLVGVNMASPYRAPRIRELRAYARGLIYPQGYPSMVAVKLLSPKGGELILDMNAAPGGKASHVVQASRGLARLIAVDRHTKVGGMAELLNKMGLNRNVIIVPYDSRYLEDLLPRGSFDKVLIDPPCSNLGVRPLSPRPRGLEEIGALAQYQRQFLASASRLVKPGGVIIYSTCTLTLSENEENVLYAVEELGLESVEAGAEVPWAEEVKYRGVIGYRYGPFVMDMPGFFISILRRPSS